MSKNKRSQIKIRFGWTILACITIIALLLNGCAQKPKVYHVGILTAGENFMAMGDGFKAKMTSLGYIEGQNIIYETRVASATAGNDEILPLAKELVDAKVDLIFSFPAPPVIAANTATQGTNIPVVFSYYQIEGSNLVKSVREPGGNMTGVRYPGPELMSRRLELLLQIAPQVKRIWIGYDKNGPNTTIALDVLRPAAQKAGVTLVEVPVTKMDELAADLAARETSSDIGIDAIFTMPDSFNVSTEGFAMFSKFAADHKLPLAGGIASQIENGALFINGTDSKKLGELAASLADKILKGSQAGTLPVITPEQTLVINYKLAQTLGLTVPDGLLKMADKIIK
jgi:putative ABC transport system substrate-binding protein